MTAVHGLQGDLDVHRVLLPKQIAAHGSSSAGKMEQPPRSWGNTAEVAVQGNLCFPALLHRQEFKMQSRTLPGQ